MKSVRKLLIVGVSSFLFVASAAISAVAQTPVDPSTTPTENTGGWVFSMAQLLSVLGLGVILFLIVMYMRYAPRFAKDEEGLKVVHADRVRPGEDLPRRAIDISQAAPVVVAPPALPAAAAAVVSPTPAAAVAAAAPAPPAAAAPAPPAADAEAPPAADAEAPPAAAAAVVSPTPAAAVAAAAPAPPAADAEAPPAADAEAAPAADAEAPPAAEPATAAERPEVSLDQEVFDATLAELLDKGTDRRVAEGQARRAAMIAARKKAEG